MRSMRVSTIQIFQLGQNSQIILRFITPITTIIFLKYLSRLSYKSVGHLEPTVWILAEVSLPIRMDRLITLNLGSILRVRRNLILQII